jgi:hypothetical protein
MAIKALGKKELKELGCNFVVANVPVFAAVSDPAKTNRMQTHTFKTIDEAKEFVTKNMPVVVFDQTGVYKEKADLPSPENLYSVRCCKLDPKEFESLRANLREVENLNFSYTFDFSCWFAGTV